MESVLIIFHVFSGKESVFYEILVLSKIRKTPWSCGFSFWEVFQLALATRIPTVYTFRLLQLNALVVFDFDLHLIFCDCCLCICFQRDLNFESFMEMKKSLFFGWGVVLLCFLNWKKLRKHLVWQRFSLALPNSLNYRSKFFKLQWGGGKGEKQSFQLQYQTLQLWAEVRGMHMKSYFSQSLEWKLITSAMKRLQPLHNKTATETLLKFFALPDLPSAALITFNQCMQNGRGRGRVFRNQRSPSSAASEMSTSENFAFEFSLNPLAWGQGERGRTAFLAEDSRDYLKAKKLEPFWTFLLLMLWIWLLASAVKGKDLSWVLPNTRVSHFYTRTPVLSISGWCFSTGAALSVRSPRATLVRGVSTSRQIQWDGRGVPGWSPSLGLAAAGMWCWKETFGANASKTSLYCSVAGQRKQIWSDLTLSSLQLVTVYPGAAEELYVVNVVGIQCLFLQVPHVQQQEHGRSGPAGCPLPIRGPISEGIQPTGALERKH